MTADQLLESLAADGVELELSATGKLTAPAGRLTDAMRSAIKAIKGEVIEAVTRRRNTPSASLAHLLDTTMQACDIKGDNAAQREQMRIDMTEWPPCGRLEVINYFRSTYPEITDYEQVQP